MNLVSTINLLTVAAEKGNCRTVLAGSMEEPDPEDGNPVPCSPYAAAKWAGSAYARMYHALYQLPVVTARIFMVYGPGQWDLAKLVPYVTLLILRNESPKLSSGRREIDWIYVDDVVDGLCAIAVSKKADARTIDVGSGQLITIG